MKKILFVLLLIFNVLIYQNITNGYSFVIKGKEYLLNEYIDDNINLKLDKSVKLGVETKNIRINSFYKDKIVNDDNLTNKLTKKFNSLSTIDKYNLSTKLYILDRNEFDTYYKDRILELQEKQSYNYIRTFFNINNYNLKEGEQYLIICYEKNNITGNIKRTYCGVPLKINVIITKTKYNKFKIVDNNTLKKHLEDKKNTLEIREKRLFDYYNKVLKLKSKNIITLNVLLKEIKNKSGIGALKTVSQCNKFNITNVNIDKINRITFNKGTENQIIVFQLLNNKQIIDLLFKLKKETCDIIKKKELEYKTNKEKYKQEAIKNYKILQNKNKYLTKQIEKLKKQNKSIIATINNNRKKAILLTKKLTKIIGKIKGKENKLRIIDKINYVLNTKYSPKHFKNQELISFVKDYISIIKLAISLM